MTENQKNLPLYIYFALAVHIPSYCWLPRRGGMWRIIYWVSPRTPEGGQAGKEDKHFSLHILCSRGAHTQPSLATSMRGNVMTKRRRDN